MKRHPSHASATGATAGAGAREAGDRVALAACLLLSVLVLALAGRHSSYLDIDSGPYLSMAHHTASSGVPRSSFLFLGGVDRLPGLANYAPPLVGWLAGLASLGAGGPLAGARAVLAASLLVAAWCSYRFLRRFSPPGFAGLATSLLIASPVLAPFAALTLSELPFIALGLAGLAAAAAVIAGPRNRGAWWGVGGAAALLPLARWLGVYFLPAFLLAFFLAHGAAGLRAHSRRLAILTLAAVLPVSLWVALVAASGVPPLPPRPAGVLGLGTAIAGTAGYLARWLAPFAAGAAALALLSRLRGGRPPETDLEGSGERRPAGLSIALPALLLGGYLAATLAARVRNTYYPLDEIGLRFVVPALPFAALALAAAFHRWGWRHRPPRLVRGLAAAAALAALGLELAAVSRLRLPEPFPAGTATLEAALTTLPDGAVVLANFGQALVAHRPALRVLGLPSRQDFRYQLALPALAREQGVAWIVLFEVPGMSDLYGPEVAAWLRQPPSGVRVRRRARLADGVIYELETERTST